MSRGKDTIMKNENRKKNYHPKRFDTDLIDIFAGPVTDIDISKVSDFITIPRGEYDTLIRHDMLFGTICDILCRHRYIDGDALRDFLDLKIRKESTEDE